MTSSVPMELLSQIYLTYIQPVMEYGCTIWGFSNESNIKRVQAIQNQIARVVSGNYDFINVRGHHLVSELGWRDFCDRRNYLMLSLMYKCVHGHAPHYLTNNISLFRDVTERVTRNIDSLNILIARPNIDKFKESLQYQGGKLWNGLPNVLQNVPTVQKFKSTYKNTFWY